MWLSYLRVDATAGDLTYDLAVDASGEGRPSPEAAGLGTSRVSPPQPGSWGASPWIVLGVLAAVAIGVLGRRRTGRPAV
jgi:hypothetical protein